MGKENTWSLVSINMEKKYKEEIEKFTCILINITVLYVDRTIFMKV